MEIIFVFTHLIMIACTIGIVYLSIFSSDSGEKESKKSVADNLSNTL
jgi:hypothetical protein